MGRIRVKLSTIKELSKRLGRVLVDTWDHMRQARMPLVASSLAYTTLLSIIPALAVSFALFKAFGGLERLYGTLEPLVLEYLAESSGKEATRTIQRFISNVHAGTVGVSGLIGLIGTTMALMSGVERAINDVWKTPVTRPLFQRIASYWLFITLGPLASAIALGAASSRELQWTGFLPKGTAGFSLTFAFFFLLYKWVPNRHVHWIPALISSVTTASIWGLARAAYGLYTNGVVTTHKLYGSLAAIPLLLVWIQISWLVVLGGAAFGAALQRRFDLR
ncbi:MAG: YihY family inner membrane protein [Bdellovibrionales bacterium]|nr:YihY family inner membrane protein [Bdellovibrionales bacterium]